MQAATVASRLCLPTDLGSRDEEGRIHVGTSGWAYHDWSDSFYPEAVADAERLTYYASRFDSVEINATFYRLPFEGMIRGWNRRLPDRFHLVVKGHRRITHLRKLSNCEEPRTAFFDRVLRLRTLRVVLWQLPPSLHKDVERLDAFLERLPGNVRHAVEFRHPSWWDAQVEEVLSRRGAAFVALSHPELPEAILPTTDFLYVRFHGIGEQLYDWDYSRGELERWARRLEPHLEGRMLYAFFNNDWNANAPRNAATFREILAPHPTQ